MRYHILDTAKYRTDCERLFGQFIDHYPYFGLTSEADHQVFEEAYGKTMQIFEQCFVN